MTSRHLVIFSAALVLLATVASSAGSPRDRWTAAQIEELRTLSIASLEALPADPTNRAADDPAAAELGRQLFFDTRLSANGRVACATCHSPIWNSRTVLRWRMASA